MSILGKIITFDEDTKKYVEELKRCTVGAGKSINKAYDDFRQLSIASQNEYRNSPYIEVGDLVDVPGEGGDVFVVVEIGQFAYGVRRMFDDASCWEGVVYLVKKGRHHAEYADTNR